MEVVKITVLRLEQVNKKYKSHQVIDNVSLMINEPGIWGLVGPNGVGKTTLLNCICNIIPANSGKIELLGESNKNPNVFKKVSYLQDNSVLFLYLTGYDHLKYISDIHKLPKNRIKEVAAYVGMDSYLQKKVENYSLGMKQHLLVALAIMNEPKLLFMDEPLNGLDPSSAIRMREILLDLKEKGTTIILSSHNLPEIDRVTKQILFLKDGKLKEVNREDHLSTYYRFDLSDHLKGVELLTEAGYTIEDEKQTIKVNLGESSLNACIEMIQGNEISIVDMQKEVSSSENLYEAYFGKRG